MDSSTNDIFFPHRVISLIYIYIFFFPCIGCREPTIVPPRGVWVSDYPHLILYLCETYRQPGRTGFLGLYYRYEDKVRVRVSLTVCSEFMIELFDNHLNESSTSILLYVGTWEEIGEQIHYTLSYNHREQGDLRKIIFNLAEDYESINPEDWFRSTR